MSGMHILRIALIVVGVAWLLLGVYGAVEEARVMRMGGVNAGLVTLLLAATVACGCWAMASGVAAAERYLRIHARQRRVATANHSTDQSARVAGDLARLAR